MNRTEREAVALYPELRGLIDLRLSGGWVFQPVVVDGTLELLTGWRAWLVGGWTDAVAIRSRTDAKAYRCNGDGGEVWGREGTLHYVLDGLTGLPKPGAPGAPTLVKPSVRRLWVPGMAP
jgi:hypothetical protein